MSQFGRFARVIGAVGSLPAPALAAEAQVTVACPDWAAEPRSQIEARIRASLLMEPRGVESVGVVCEAGQAKVELVAGSSRQLLPVQRRGALEDDVVATVENALRELPADPAAAPTAEPAPPTAPVPTPPSAPDSAAEAAPVRAKPPAPTRNITEVDARGLTERWSDNWAVGAQLGLATGGPRLDYGLTIAGRIATNEPNTFELSEWSAAARVQVTVPEALGLRGSLSLGASLFVTAPASGVLVQSASLLAAPFLELGVSRPFWWGPFGLTPAAGARLFAGRRSVTVDGAQELEVPWLTPHLALVLIARLPI